MARKIKPRTKPKPKPVFKTWSVTTPSGTVDVEAEDVAINHTLIFERDGEVYMAFAPGTWTTVDRIEPDQD